MILGNNSKKLNSSKQSTLKRSWQYLFDKSVEPRIRLLNIILICVFIAAAVSIIPMVVSGTRGIWVNVLLLVFITFLEILNLNYKKTYLAGFLLSIMVSVIFLPVMYFTAGGMKSAMPLWFMAGTIASYLLVSDRLHKWVFGLNVVIDVSCLAIEYFRPEMVATLADDGAVFFDIVIGFLATTFVLFSILLVHLNSEKNQRILVQEKNAELEEKQKELEYALRYDTLTGIPNRYSYAKRIEELEEAGLKNDLVVISADVNGLKTANDDLGHEAGDELIVGTAIVLCETYSKYGEVYRIGGDEFLAILHTDVSQEALSSELAENSGRWHGKYNPVINISVGYAFNSELNLKSFAALQKISDKKMYEAKAEFYRTSGYNRRRSR